MSEDRLIADQQFVRENTGHQTLQKNRAGSGMIEQPPQASDVGMASGLIEIGRGKWNAHDRACLWWKSVKPAGRSASPVPCITERQVVALSGGASGQVLRKGRIVLT